MECQECKQNPATLHFAQVINGEKREIHVCHQCAKEKGYVAHDDESYSLHNLLSGLFNFDTEKLHHSTPNKTAERQMECKKCGMTYQEFAQVGKFGCASCYQTFSAHLNPIFRRVHSGNTTHDGKVPKRVGKDISARRKVKELKWKLQQLIAEEEFEEAAKIRDQIKEMEKSLNQSGEGDV
ncbi:Protein-arginine kinase activator protein McsA [Gracilibacillus ureilyticus]|uniref:Protein-arginine kinase activator protein McsA n=1 Tax=Gracilibacillus ureilyticus TaxID=531814 RepID=A0A1H9VD40_9BACI|nr:UvrB/UvrC motif-containing protein [Gracilibacillus ureilyticus]SES19595.1 Protein-arginine kinase activator protein McsA [Gracilibacillus ureilyticus]